MIEFKTAIFRPAVKVFLEEAEPGAVGPGLGAGDGLVVVAVEAAVEDALEGPPALGVAQPVELTLPHCKARNGTVQRHKE